MNPTLRAFDTTITRIDKRKLAGSKASNARKKGANGASKNSESSSGSGAEWEIECEDTGMYIMICDWWISAIHLRCMEHVGY